MKKTILASFLILSLLVLPFTFAGSFGYHSGNNNGSWYHSFFSWHWSRTIPTTTTTATTETTTTADTTTAPSVGVMEICIFGDCGW